jgi:hypothetical protein
MVSITLSVPAGIKDEMDRFQEINWSAVAREAIKRKLVMLDKFEEFTKDSEFTEDDALRLGKELSAKTAKKHRRNN